LNLNDYLWNYLKIHDDDDEDEGWEKREIKKKVPLKIPIKTII
jgi:hypothetical protein